MGMLFLLENVRFYKEEEQNCSDFAKKLSQNGDVFVNDAFGPLTEPMLLRQELQLIYQLLVGFDGKGR